MTHDRKSKLRRALDDMNEGMRALLSSDPSSPELIGELLEGRDPGPRARRGSAKRTPRSDQLRARARRSSELRLVRGD